MNDGRITAMSPIPDDREAAAIVAALAAFRRSVAAPATDAPAPMGAWQRTALLEGVDHAPRPSAPWGS